MDILLLSILLLVLLLTLILPFKIFYFYSKDLDLGRITSFKILFLFLLIFVFPTLNLYLSGDLYSGGGTALIYLTFFLIMFCYIPYLIWLTILSFIIKALKKKNGNINKKIFIILSILPLIWTLILSILYM